MSSYESLDFAGVTAPSCEAPGQQDRPLDLTLPPPFIVVYDFAAERAAVKQAAEVEESDIKEVAERRAREEARKKREEEEAAVRVQKEKERAERNAELAKKEEEAKAAALLRQASLEREQKEEVRRSSCCLWAWGSDSPRLLLPEPAPHLLSLFSAFPSPFSPRRNGGPKRRHARKPTRRGNSLAASSCDSGRRTHVRTAWCSSSRIGRGPRRRSADTT